MGKRLNYTDCILTAIAVLLALNFLVNLGWIAANPVHAAGATPVQIVAVDKPLPVSIESPRGTLFGRGDVIPVVIEGPLALNGSICANPCR